VPVSTLAALAQGGYREYGWMHLAASIDARMNEVYWGSFECVEGLVRPLQEEQVCPPESVPELQGDGWYGIGSGWLTYADQLTERLGAVVVDRHGEALPHAQDVAVLAADAMAKGMSVPAEQALPIYLRDQVVQRPVAK
jgi:tRNA threonylcarbamoyladenosine biosynthesis protein TsaB